MLMYRSYNNSKMLGDVVMFLRMNFDLHTPLPGHKASSNVGELVLCTSFLVHCGIYSSTSSQCPPLYFVSLPNKTILISCYKSKEGWRMLFHVDLKNSNGYFVWLFTVDTVFPLFSQVQRPPGPPYTAHEINKGHPNLAATPPGHASSHGLSQVSVSTVSTSHLYGHPKGWEAGGGVSPPARLPESFCLSEWVCVYAW